MIIFSGRYSKWSRGNIRGNNLQGSQPPYSALPMRSTAGADAEAGRARKHTRSRLWATGEARFIGHQGVVGQYVDGAVPA